jgi:hypothetical protein
LVRFLALDAIWGRADIADIADIERSVAKKGAIASV